MYACMLKRHAVKVQVQKEKQKTRKDKGNVPNCHSPSRLRHDQGATKMWVECDAITHVSSQHDILLPV